MLFCLLLYGGEYDTSSKLFLRKWCQALRKPIPPPNPSYRSCTPFEIFCFVPHKISQKVLRKPIPLPNPLLYRRGDAQAPSTSHAYIGEGALQGISHAHAYTTTKKLKVFSSLRTRASGATSAGSSGVAIQRHCHYKSVLLCVLYRHNSESTLDCRGATWR